MPLLDHFSDHFRIPLDDGIEIVGVRATLDEMEAAVRDPLCTRVYASVPSLEVVEVPKENVLRRISHIRMYDSARTLTASLDIPDETNPEIGRDEGTYIRFDIEDVDFIAT